MEEKIEKIEKEIESIKSVMVKKIESLKQNLKIIIGLLDSITQATAKSEKEIRQRLSDIEKILKTEEKKENFAKTWIVHRTLKKENRETYITNDSVKEFVRFTIKGVSYKTTFDKKEAMKFTREKAIELRDGLNEFRKGKRYLWVVSNELN